MGDKNDGAVDLAAYRDRRTKEGTWPPSDKDQKEYWERRMTDLLDRRSAMNSGAKKVTKAPPKETLPPVDPKTGKPNFTKEEMAEFDGMFPEET